MIIVQFGQSISRPSVISINNWHCVSREQIVEHSFIPQSIDVSVEDGGAFAKQHAQERSIFAQFVALSQHLSQCHKSERRPSHGPYDDGDQKSRRNFAFDSEKVRLARGLYLCRACMAEAVDIGSSPISVDENLEDKYYVWVNAIHVRRNAEREPKARAIY